MSSLTAYTPQITILDRAINAIDGLYSLNDMHKASGGEKKYQPAFFMRNQETKDLIKEIELTDNVKAVKRIQGGIASEQGTYVCKDLVYRYAMWISPKFALLVIRTFDKLVTGELKVATNNSELTAEQTLPLREAVSKLVTKLGILYPEGYKLVHQRFSVGHIKKLKPEQIPQAVEYVHSLLMQAQAKETPITDFTHSQYITKVKGEVMEYVWSLQKAIVAAGAVLPKYPDFSEEDICQAFIASLVRHNRMMLSFDYKGAPLVSFVPHEHAVVSRENIANVVDFADKKILPSIINKAVERLGE